MCSCLWWIIFRPAYLQLSLHQDYIETPSDLQFDLPSFSGEPELLLFALLRALRYRILGIALSPLILQYRQELIEPV